MFRILLLFIGSTLKKGHLNLLKKGSEFFRFLTVFLLPHFYLFFLPFFQHCNFPDVKQQNEKSRKVNDFTTTVQKWFAWVLGDSRRSLALFTPNLSSLFNRFIIILCVKFFFNSYLYMKKCNSFSFLRYSLLSTFLLLFPILHHLLLILDEDEEDRLFDCDREKKKHFTYLLPKNLIQPDWFFLSFLFIIKKNWF